MESWVKVLLRTLLILAVLACIVFECSDGARGGSRGGSRISSRISRTSRNIRTSRTTKVRAPKVRYYRGPVYRSSSWKTGLAIGTVYGLMSYKRRRMYYSYPNREPKVCFNEYNLKNGTYGYFICPEPDDPDSFNYCCGEEGKQRCCSRTEHVAQTKKKGSSAVAGIVVAVVIASIAIAVVVYCCVIKRRRRAAAKGGVVVRSPEKVPGHAEQHQPLNPGYAGGAVPGTNPGDIPMNTYGGVPPGPPPAGYDAGGAQGLPYNPNPGAGPIGAPVGEAYYPPPPVPGPQYGPPNPQPYPGPQYGPPNPEQPYPGPPQPFSKPVGFEGAENEKPPLPPSDVSGGLPYPVDPTAAAPGPGTSYPPPGVGPTAPPYSSI